MDYKIEFITEAEEDFDSLDKSIQKQVSKKIDALSNNPYLGEPLGNKYGIDLTGFYKLYVAKKKYRIVYRLIGEHIVEGKKRKTFRAHLRVPWDSAFAHAAVSVRRERKNREMVSQCP